MSRKEKKQSGDKDDKNISCEINTCVNKKVRTKHEKKGYKK